MAEEKDTDVRAEELDDRDALIGDEEMLGEIEEADGHHGTPAIKVISTGKESYFVGLTKLFCRNEVLFLDYFLQEQSSQQSPDGLRLQ